MIVAAGIVAMVLAMVIGPAFAPPEFAWLRHSTSEQAGQNTPGAWIMRAGFYAYGLAVLIAALRDWSHWPAVRAALVVFGTGLLGAAFWSHAPILPELSADMHEDFLHSVASGVVGTSFALACAARLFTAPGTMRDALAWAGLLISVAVPLAMLALPQVAGLLQRSMFAFSFVFLLREFGDPATSVASTR